MYWLYPTEPLSGASSCPGHYVAGMGLAVDTGDVTTFMLDSDSPLVTLDYGTERAGYPFFSVADVTHQVQIEVKFSESSVGLAHPWADGPYSFATGLANSCRVEKFDVTSPGCFAAPLIQGGQTMAVHSLAGGGKYHVRRGWLRGHNRHHRSVRVS
ncbi:RhaA is able to hydrolyze alpha-1 [Seiridium cupressi]